MGLGGGTFQRAGARCGAALAGSAVMGLTAGEMMQAMEIQQRLRCGWSALAQITGRNEFALRNAAELFGLTPAPPRGGVAASPPAPAAPVAAPLPSGIEGAFLLPLLALAHREGRTHRVAWRLAEHVGMTPRAVGWTLRALSRRLVPMVSRAPGSDCWKLTAAGWCYVETLAAGLAGPDGAP